jgi:hypothetical protein
MPALMSVFDPFQPFHQCEMWAFWIKPRAEGAAGAVTAFRAMP